MRRRRTEEELEEKRTRRREEDVEEDVKFMYSVKVIGFNLYKVIYFFGKSAI